MENPTKSTKKLVDEVFLWDQFRAGDDNAFTQIFDLYSDRLYRYGTKFIFDEDLVKDCIQDLFIKIYKNRNCLSSTDNPALYLFKALKNKIIDAIQSNERLIYFSQLELPFHIEFSFDPEEEKLQQQEEQESDLIIKEKFKNVMNMLSDRQKEAIYLRYQAGMTYEEISQLLNINYQSTRNLIYRAMNKIRSEMNLSVFLILFLKYIN